MKYAAFFLLLIGYPLLVHSQVKTGLEVLLDHQFDILKNKRVGLITNPTGVDRNLKSDIDLFFESGQFKLVALFSPEHGIRGDYQAGEDVHIYKDPKTGVQVYSLYGANHKPTPEIMAGLDVLVYDIQDIGVRSYTYISTLGLAMEAAAENNVAFVVLDRPDPLGGLKIEGPITENGYTSFVSQYPIPYIYGLTSGELATYLNEEGLLHGKKCKLHVVKMEGWYRNMLFKDTGLPWVPSSPHIPLAQTIDFYPATGIFGELNDISIGVGYTLPFQTMAAPWMEADSLADALNNLNLPGLLFRPIHYKPYYGTYKGVMVHGIQLYITNAARADLTLVQFYIVQESMRLWPSFNVFSLCDSSRLAMFDKVCGTNKVRKKFIKHFQVDDIRKVWMQSNDRYCREIEKYLLYPKE